MNERYRDMLEAIRRDALVHASPTTLIIRSEQSAMRDPWIFDFRALLMQPQWLDRYAEIFWEQYADQLPFQVGGMETAAIPLVSAIVMKGVQRGTPVNGFYLRKSRKRHGLMKRVEGTLTDEPIVLVDDLINSGQTLLQQIEVLAQLDRTVRDVFILLAFRAPDTYRMFAERGTRLTSLFSLPDLGMPLLGLSAQVPQQAFRERWCYRAPNPGHHVIVQKSAPVFAHGMLYFGAADGGFRALDAATGAVRWEFRIGRHPIGKGILSSPALHNDTVYFGAYDGTVYALDALTGKKRWTFDDADWIGSSPAVAADLGLLFIGLEFGLFKKRGGIIALDLHTGAERWRATHRELTHASPRYIHEEGLVVIGSNDGVLYAYEARTGRLRWTFLTQGHIKTTAAYDAKRRLVLIGSMDGTLYALNASNGVPVFARQTAAGIYSIPLVDDDRVFVASLDKYVYAIDLRTGKDLWEFETSGRIFASPALYAGSLWIGSNDGRLYELDPAQGTLRGFFQSAERVINKVAYDETTGHLFVPTSASEIYCIARADTADQ